MDHINGNQNNYKAMYDKACNLAINIKNQLQLPNQLPPHCNLVLDNDYDFHLFETYAIITFKNPQSNREGQVIVGDPEFSQKDFRFPNLNGSLHLFCMIDAFNGYFMRITVDSIEEVLSIVEFCQQLLEHQPDENELAFVRVPPHMMNHWCIPESLRQRNLRERNRVIVI
jgi:hypothetical protein